MKSFKPSKYFGSCTCLAIALQTSIKDFFAYFFFSIFKNIRFKVYKTFVKEGKKFKEEVASMNLATVHNYKFFSYFHKFGIFMDFTNKFLQLIKINTGTWFISKSHDNINDLCYLNFSIEEKRMQEENKNAE